MKLTKEYLANLEDRCKKANFAPFDVVVPKPNDKFEWNERTVNIAENWLSGKRGKELTS